MASRRRREPGTGSIVETSGGFRASIRVLDESGVVRQRTKRTRTYGEAEAWLDELVARTVGGTILQSDRFSGATITEFLRHWMGVKYGESEAHGVPTAQTLALYNSIIKNWIVPYLGHLQLSRIDRKNLESWVTWLNSQTSERTGKPLSQDRKAHAYRTLRQAYRYAADNGIVARSPFVGMRTVSPSQGAVKERTLTDAEFKAFVKLIESKGCQHAEGYCRLRWELAVYTARRQGEVLGLYWKHVHLTTKPPHMAIKTHLVPFTWRHGCGTGSRGEDGAFTFPCGKAQGQYCPARKDGGLKVVDGTKGGRDITPTVPITELVPAFRAHKKAQDAEMKAAVKEGTFDLLRPDHSGLVFVQPKTGRPYSPKMDDTIFKSLLTEAGISRSYRIHDLRHTAITRLVDRTGGNLAIAQRIAGHKSFMTTLKYSHQDLSAMEQALGKVMGSAEKDAESGELRGDRKASFQGNDQEPGCG